VDAERGAYGLNNAALRANHRGWWLAHLFVAVEVAAAVAEDFEVAVADRVACVARRSSGC